MSNPNINFGKTWTLIISYSTTGKAVFKAESSPTNSDVLALRFMLFPWGSMGYPAMAEFTMLNLSEKENQLLSSLQSDSYDVTFSAGLGGYQTILFNGKFKAYSQWYEKPDYIFNVFALGVSNDKQYDLTKQGIAIDIPRGSTIEEGANTVASALSIPVVNIFGVNGNALMPPTKIVAKNFYNAMDLYSDTAQVSYSYDHLKNYLNIYPNHKTRDADFTDTPSKPKLVTDIIGYPSVDVGTQNMSVTKLLTNQIIYFKDIIQLDTSIVAFSGLEQAPIQYLSDRNKNANFFVHTTLFIGDTRISENVTWAQQIYGVSQKK
jgi:hypothetical protein